MLSRNGTRTVPLALPLLIIVSLIVSACGGSEPAVSVASAEAIEEKNSSDRTIRNILRIVFSPRRIRGIIVLVALLAVGAKFVIDRVRGSGKPGSRG